MRDYLITIAVPVYNVEKYLKRCLDSLLSQELEDIEILLVDDGSKDNSGNICDDYEKNNGMIRVIHQENRGLAAVRNVCVKQARGEYISFIDSDDYVLEGAYRHFKDIIKDKQCDILCYGYVDVYGDSSEKAEIITNDFKEVVKEYSAKDAVEQMLLPGDIDVITCNKVIKVSLFDNIEYPIGKLYEDMFTNYKFVCRAEKILTTNRKYYVYCHRPTSIGQMAFNTRTMDLVKAAKEVYDFGIKFCDTTDNLEIGYLYWMVIVANMMIKSNVCDKEYIRKVQSVSRKNVLPILRNGIINKTRKIELILFGFSYSVYKLIYKEYVARNR